MRTKRASDEGVPKTPGTAPTGASSLGGQSGGGLQTGTNLQTGGLQNFASGMLDSWNPTTPQGFTQWAGLLRPVTESVLTYGGFPAMMALYGLFTGNQNFTRGFSKTQQPMQQNPYAPAQSSLLTMPKAASLRLPLPESVDGELVMPNLEKLANEWSRGGLPALSATNAWGSGGLPALRPNNPWGQQQQNYNQEIIPNAVRFDGYGDDGDYGGGESPLPNAQHGAGSNLAVNMAKHMAIYEAERRGLHAVAKEVGKKALPKLGLKAVTKAVPGGVLMDTPINIVNNLTDLAGLPAPLGGSTKDHYVYQKPVIDPATGQPKIGPDGKPEWEFGFNPSAMGRDWNEWTRNTTPDGTFMGGRSTGNAPLDHTLSYLGSSWNAYHEPVTSALDLAKFQYWDANPLRDLDLLWSRQARKEGPKSIPLIFAREIVDGSDAPMDRYAPGGALHEQTKADYMRGTGGTRFSRFYNPEGTTGPDLPHATRWLGSPIQQTKNWFSSVKAKGFGPTMEQAWLQGPK